MLSYRGVPAGYEDDDDGFDSIDVTVSSKQNLKITVVPDITTAASLNDKDFDCKLSCEMKIWFKDFQETYNKCKRTPATQQQLKLILTRDPQPLLLALKLFASSPGCNYLKNKNMALFILETVSELYKQNPSIEASCDDNTRLVAFNFVKTCGIIQLYKAVTETYQLQKIEKYLIPKLQDLIAKGFYKDVIYWSIYLNITHLFGLYDLILPLILQEKVSLVEEFLKVGERHQLPTVQFLDGLLDRKRTVRDNCEEILQKHEYIDIKYNVLAQRPMCKLLTRLVKKFNIDSKYTPNLKFSKTCSYVHYLFYKYKDGGMSTESWRELAREEANKSKALQIDLITKITNFGDLDEAAYWAQLYKIPLEECPIVLQLKFQDAEKSTNESNWEKSSSSNSLNESPNTSAVSPTPKENEYNITTYERKNEFFLSLKLPAESIVLVDTKAKFLDMLSHLEQQLLIGLDSEWKPSSMNDNSAALIQLATIERVYLVDCLSSNLNVNEWKLLGSRIFNNLEILKLGFCLNFDLKVLQKSLPLQLNLQATSCYLDLRELWRRIKYMQISGFPYEQIYSTGESLCALTELCLGKRLDKSNQCSNWAKRPLRPDQMVYAALDAHCLLEIYQVFAEILLRAGINIDAIVEEITTSTSNNTFRVKRKTAPSNFICSFNTNVEQTDNNTCSKNTRYTQIKFIGDVMVIGLSRELRKLGLDCLQIHTNGETNRYIKLARDEHRYVLTRDSRYMMFCRELPQKQCIHIPSDNIENQIINILQYFRLQIDERSFFTRCTHCNGNDFLLANRYEMQLINSAQVQQFDTGSIPPFDKNEKYWNLRPVNKHIIKKKVTFKGKTIKVHRIQPLDLYNQYYFFICDNCGVCTWPESERINQTVLEYLNPNLASGYAANNTYNNTNVVSQ